jgi:hypothetical protein
VASRPYGRGLILTAFRGSIMGKSKAVLILGSSDLSQTASMVNDFIVTVHVSS